MTVANVPTDQGPLGNARSGRLSLSPRAVSARSSGVSGASRKSRLGRVWGVSAASGGVWPASGPASRVWAASLARLSRPAGLASVPGSSFVVVGSVLGWSLASFFSRPGRVPRLRRVSAASRGVLAASCRVPELASPASRPRLKDRALPRALLHGAPVRQEPPARVRSEDAGRRRVKGPSGCYFQLDVGESSCCDRCERMGAPRSLKRPPRKKKMSDRSPGRQ